MKTAMLGFFGDFESAELARAKLLMSSFPVDQITLTAVQGPGQSRIRATPAARDKFMSLLRALMVHERDPAHAERLADRVERGAATVTAYAHNSEAARRVAAVLRDCGAMDIVGDAAAAPTREEPSLLGHEETWPSYLWPAT